MTCSHVPEKFMVEMASDTSVKIMRMVKDGKLPKVQFLGHIINPEGITMDPAKIEAIKNWKTSQNPTEIRSFIGLAGYYRRFNHGFSNIVAPLTGMTRKNVVFNWGKFQEEAFEELKKRLTQAPILVLFDGNKDLVVCAQASHQGLGCDFMQ
ncbi:putative mitochondrial protein AtMg00860 [Bidens hawaiensis]|uniref:putative mitochondrial protein AtMg00860 n=1 Tax=Bidens hawaiensis TaxID=980011 RepID=UPI00404A88A5